MAYQKLSDAWREQVESQTLGALGALGGVGARISRVAESKTKTFGAKDRLNTEILAKRDRFSEPDFQICPWGPPKAPKAPKVSADNTIGLLHRVLNTLDSGCPEHVEPERWRQAVEDGRRFLASWGAQAQALGWTTRELFGLHTPPDKPAPKYRRLSRYGETGLIWLLEGREVIALTQETAAIRWPSGSVTVYRKSNKPALGPLGDSLDD
jgi:hypothetical protein